mgnify:CR=1 FL=1
MQLAVDVAQRIGTSTKKQAEGVHRRCAKLEDMMVLLGRQVVEVSKTAAVAASAPSALSGLCGCSVQLILHSSLSCWLALGLLCSPATVSPN